MTIIRKSLNQHVVRFLTALSVPLLSALLSGCGSSSNHTVAAVPNPSVEGPIAGNPFFVGGTTLSLASVGYEQAEYFISGTAHNYLPAGELTSDGKWNVSSAEQAAYKTRILVYRPIRPADFNGTVIVEWFNVSAGIDSGVDWLMAHTELIRSGYAWVGVSAQQVGVEGGPSAVSGFGLFLKAADPARYGSLHHPGDSFSYDIYSQVGQAVLHPNGIDPLNGLKIKHMIAVGQSQSAFRLTTYVNAFASNGLYSGFLIHSRGHSSAALSQSPQAVAQAPGVVTVRNDLKVPVITLQTESDLFILGSYPDRQADSGKFRLWEVAGAAHVDLYNATGGGDLGNDPSFATVASVNNPVPGIVTCAKPVNSGPIHFLASAAIAALNNWIVTGSAPAVAPRLEVAGNPPAYVFDNLGNVKGGVRTPYVDVPIATLSGEGQDRSSICILFGTTALFDNATLAALYPTHAAYVAAVNASVDHAVGKGFLLQPDGALIKTAAQISTVGGP